MDATVKMSVKSLLLAGLVLMALVTAYLLGSQGAAPSAQAATPTAAPAAAVEKPRVVRMVGAGEATAVPDQLSFALSVSEKRFDLDDALEASNATMRRVLAAVDEAGVDRADVQTTGLNMQPEYDYHSYGPPTLTGYRVTQRARVLVDDLSAGGGVISAAVSTGGNGVRASDIRLQVADTDAVLAKARDRAVEAATAKAQQYADATGQVLGEVLSIRETSAPRQPAYVQQLGGRAYGTADAVMPLPIRAGKDDLTVRIAVVWAFE